MVLPLLALLPLWTVHFFPSVDGPIHLWLAEIILHYGDQPVLQEYLEPNSNIEPNLLVYGLLAGFTSLFDATTAEKITLSLWFVVYYAAALYTVRAIDPEASAIALLFVPLAFTYFVHQGFYNFTLSFAFYILGIGFWGRHRDRLTGWRLVGLGAIALLLILNHLVGFGALFSTLLALEAGTALAAWWHARPHRRAAAELKLALGRLARLLIAFAPALAIALLASARQGVQFAIPASPLRHIADFVVMRNLQTFDWPDRLLFAPFLALLAILAAWEGWRRVRAAEGLQVADVLVLVALIYSAIYFLNPMSGAAVELGMRLQPFILFLILLWLAATIGPRARPWIIAVAALTVLLTAGYRTVLYQRMDVMLREYVALARHVQPGSTLLALEIQDDLGRIGAETGTRATFKHVGAHVARLTDGVYLRAPLISRQIFGYFPYVYREAYDPFVHIGPGIEHVFPPQGDLTYGSGAGEVDYVALLDVPDEARLRRDAEHSPLLADLSETFSRVCISGPLDVAWLYRRSDDGAAADSQRLCSRSAGPAVE